MWFKPQLVCGSTNIFVGRRQQQFCRRFVEGLCFDCSHSLRSISAVSCGCTTTKNPFWCRWPQSVRSSNFVHYFFINWFIKRQKVVISAAPSLPRDGRHHFRYSLHLRTEGWPGWVGLSGLDKYRARRSTTSLMRRTPLLLHQTSLRYYAIIRPLLKRKRIWEAKLIQTL